ncbi:MAG TPA: T9SS type A sorting domain-containing protein [Bacteroidales bacterium]|nr:T9SS type A sorting domain-containing protein [Bacteroidales bacterium]
MKKAIIFILIILSLAINSKTFCQTFLNGSFENNTAVTDHINLTNSQYNNFMSNSTAFGDYNSGGPNGGGMDIITSSLYCGPAQNNNWYVALTSGGTDAISLELSSPLIAGSGYTITFYDRACNLYVLGSPVLIGVSNVSNSFGDLVYTAPNPVSNVWTQRTASFISPINALYVTIKCGGINSPAPLTQIDNFEISLITSASEFNGNSSFKIISNPASDILNIEAPGNNNIIRSIKIYNQSGAVILIANYTDKLDISNFPAGSYIVELSTDKEVFFKKFIKQ